MIHGQVLRNDKCLPSKAAQQAEPVRGCEGIGRYRFMASEKLIVLLAGGILYSLPLPPASISVQPLALLWQPQLPPSPHILPNKSIKVLILI